MEKEKQILRLIEELYLNRPRSPIPTRRSRSVPRNETKNEENALSFGVKWPFDHYIQPGWIQLVERASKPVDGLKPPVEILADIKAPYELTNHGGIVTIRSIKESESATNPFFDGLYLAANPFGRNRFLMPSKETSNVETASNPFLSSPLPNAASETKKAITPEADIMPPNYTASTISRIQKSKLPLSKKKTPNT